MTQTETRAEPAAPSVEPRRRASRLKVGNILQRYALLGIWVLVIVLFGIREPSTFLTTANLQNILGSQAVLVLLTLGLIIPMTAGDYDLSIGSVAALSAMTLAILNVDNHWAILPAALAGISTGLLAGFLNGAIVTLVGIDPFIVTLGSGSVIGGIVFWISDSNTITGISNQLVNLVIYPGPLGVPMEFFYGLALCVIVWYALEYTPFGRRLLFVGRGRSVSRLSGIRVERVRWQALTVSGTIAALAGVVYAGSTGSADPTSATNFLLPAFASAFLGATTILPGRFNAWGTFVAVYFLVTGITGLQLMGAQSFVQQLFFGGALIISVALAQLGRRRETRDAGAIGQG